MPTKFNAVTRYITDSKDIKAELPKVKPKALRPRPAGPDKLLETSVVGIDNLPKVKIWELGNKYIMPNIFPKGRQMKGRADFEVSKIMELGLDCTDDQKFDGRHSNIVNWPAEEEDIAEKVMELTLIGKFVQYPGETRSLHL